MQGSGRWLNGKAVNAWELGKGYVLAFWQKFHKITKVGGKEWGRVGGTEREGKREQKLFGFLLLGGALGRGILKQCSEHQGPLLTILSQLDCWFRCASLLRVVLGQESERLYKGFRFALQSVGTMVWILVPQIASQVHPVWLLNNHKCALFFQNPGAWDMALSWPCGAGSHQWVSSQWCIEASRSAPGSTQDAM